MLYFGVGLVELDEISKNSPSGGTTDRSHGKQAISKTVANGHQVTKAREGGAVVAFVICLGGLGERIDSLPLLVSSESLELEPRQI
jgi:hypothetical protein